MNDRQRCQDNEHLQRFTPANEMAPGCAGAISEKALMRITYSGIYDEPIRLTEGL